MERKPSSFTTNVLKLTGGGLAIQLIAILAAPIITRLYAPDSFGMATIFFALSGVMGIIACLGYELAIMLPEKDEEAGNLFWGSIFFVVIITFLSIFLVLIGRREIAGLFKMPGLASYLWLLPLAVFFAGLFLAMNYWTTRMKHFGQLSLAKIVNSGTTALTKIGLGLAGYNYAGGLIWGGVLGSFFSANLLAQKIWRANRTILLQGINLSKILKGLRRYKRFPLFSLGSSLLNTLSFELPAFLLAFFFSPAIVGFYGLGRRVLQLPMGLLGKAIAQVFYQKAAESRQTGKLAGVVEGVFKRLVAIAIFPFLLLTIIGKESFIIIFGVKWAEAGVYAQIISLWIFFVFLSSPLNFLFNILEKQNQRLIFDLVLITVSMFSLLLGGLTHQVRFTLGLFALTGIITYFSMCLWLLTISGVSKGKGLFYLGKYTGYSLPFLGLVILAKWLIKIEPLGILLLGTFLLIIYFVIITREDKELKENIKLIFREGLFKR